MRMGKNSEDYINVCEYSISMLGMVDIRIHNIIVGNFHGLVESEHYFEEKTFME